MSTYLSRILACAIVGSAVLILVTFPFPRHTRISPEEEEQRLTALLPAGTIPNKVTQVLDSLGIEHSELDGVSREMRGLDRKTATHGLLMWDNIRVHVYFDGTYRVASHSIEVYRAGPWTRERCNGTSCTGFLD